MRDAPDITIRLVLAEGGACAVLLTRRDGARDVAPHLAGLATELNSRGLRLAGVSVARSRPAGDGASPVAASESLADAARRLLSGTVLESPARTKSLPEVRRGGLSPASRGAET
jgi:hypothetical protein